MKVVVCLLILSLFFVLAVEIEASQEMGIQETSIGGRILYYVEDDGMLFYGPMGKLGLTENIDIRGSYLIGSKEGFSFSQMSSEITYGVMMDENIKPYSGIGISRMNIIAWSFLSADILAGIETSITEEINTFVEGVYSVPITEREVLEGVFQISGGLSYSF